MESINVDISDANKNVTIIMAGAEAKAIKIRNEAKAIAVNNTIHYESKAYSDTSSLLGLIGKDLLDFIYY